MAAQAAGKANIVSTPQEPQQPGWNPPPVPPPPAAPPQQGAPQQGAPQYGGPPYGEPQYGAPQYGPPQPGGPQYGAPQHGAPQPPYDAGQYPGQYSQQPTPPPYDGGQFGQQFGQPGAPAPKSRKTLWILLGVIGGVVILAVVGLVLLFSLVGNATGKAKGQAEEFTKLLVEGQNEEAYDGYLTDALKENISKSRFVRGIAGLELNSNCKANYNSVSSSSKNGRAEAEVSGTLDCDGRIIDLEYRFVGDDLKMNDIKVKPRK